MIYLRKIITLLVLTAILASCKKDKGDSEAEKDFDIDNPAGYCIYLKSQDAAGSNPAIFLLSFEGESLPDGSKAVRRYQVMSYFGGGALIDLNTKYTVPDKKTLNVQGIARFTIENGKITSAISNEGTGKTVSEYRIIKKMESNQLAGKTFTGKYYRMSNEIFRNSFFYRIDDAGTTLSAGLTAPNAERTGSFEHIGNIAIASYPPNGTSNTDIELLIKVNNNLRTQYYDALNKRFYYGEFIQQ